MTTRLSLLILSIIVLAGSQPVHPQRTARFNGFELVDKDGNITKKPADYRDHYELLGTYTVLDPKGNQMHVTYATPGDGCVLSQNREISRWRGVSEGNIWNGSRQTDDR